MNDTALNIALAVSAFMMCMLLVYTLRYRKERGVRFFVWVMGGRVLYAVCVILELNSNGLPLKLFFRHMEQTAYVLIVPYFVLCLLDLFGRDAWLRPRKRMLIFFLPICFTVLIWTNPFTGLTYTPAALVDDDLVITQTTFTDIYALLAFGVMGVCVLYLLLYIRNIRSDHRKLWIWVISLGCAAFLVEIVKTAKQQWIPWLLPISVLCSVFGLVMLGILYRHRLFSLVPMARNFVIETLQDGILIANSKGTVIDHNPFLRSVLTHANNRPMAGRQVGELLLPFPEWRDACLRMKEGSFEISQFIDGMTRFYMVKVYLLRTEEGRTLGTVSSLFDITEKHTRLEQIARLNQMKDELFTLVSHDVREPLSLQVSLIELLEEDMEAFSPEHAETIEMLSEQIKNTNAQVLNLLNWFRGQREGLVLHPSSLELTELVWEAYRLLMLRSEAKFVNLHIDIEAGLCVYADREAMVMVIRNLLSNAIKYSDKGGFIHVSARRADDLIVIAIKDNGVGMSEQQLLHLFDATRFDSSAGTEGERGTGLGLHVSRQFIRLSGGDIWAESRQNEGSTFYFSLMNGVGK